ncbi:unnamed protein product [Prorocentrum cordatum]|uniref:Secreted protein n=1 Tax=Prorocentrum cordatum TaxID=2364126 RepID=A0ABN9WN86_9DINO|nr:unnamed protein product [Polarella glacialis]
MRHSGSSVLVLIMDIAVTRHCAVRWERMLGNNIFGRSQDWHSRHRERTWAAGGLFIYEVHSLRCDTTNSAAAKSQKVHLFSVTSRCVSPADVGQTLGGGLARSEG